MTENNAEAECAALAEHAFNAARGLLEDEGSFRPFALVHTAEGEYEILMAEAEDGEGDAEQDLDALRADLSAGAEAGDLRAAAVVANTWLTEENQQKRDAVIVIVEHESGLAQHRHQYYTIEERRGDVTPAYAVEWQESATLPGEPTLFVPS